MKFSIYNKSRLQGAFGAGRRNRRPSLKRYRASINIALRIMMIGIFSLSGQIGAEVSQDEMRVQSEYKEGYALGILEAEAEIKSNSMTFYTFGLVIPPTSGEGPRKRHGLPIKHVGSVVDPKGSGVVHGHNETIEKYLGVAQ